MITTTCEDPLPPDWPGVWVPVFPLVRAGALVGLAPGVCVTLVAVAVEVAVGDTLVVALGDAPVVGDETAGRVERGVVDGLDVDVLVGDGLSVDVAVGDGLSVDVAVGDGDGLGVGDGQIKGRSHSLAAYEFFTTAKAPECLQQRAEELGRQARACARARCLAIAAGRKDQTPRTGLDFGYFLSDQKSETPLLDWPARLHTSYFTPMGRVIIILLLVYLKSREKPEK